MKKSTETACGAPLAIGPTVLYCGLAQDHRKPLCEATWHGNTFRWPKSTVTGLREPVTA